MSEERIIMNLALTYSLMIWLRFSFPQPNVMLKIRFQKNFDWMLSSSFHGFADALSNFDGTMKSFYPF